MSFCPFISTPSEKKSPSDFNCKDCCFYIADFNIQKKGCAILITAHSASKTLGILSKNQ